MSSAIAAGALVVAAFNALAAALGGWLWYTGHAAEGPGVRAFWVLLRVGQGAALTLAVAVGSLAAAGKYPSDRLFYLYALLPLAVAFLAEQLRVASAQFVLDQRGLENAQAISTLPDAEQRSIVVAILRREVGVMALSALVVVFLALRAASTAHGF